VESTYLRHFPITNGGGGGGGLYTSTLGLSFKAAEDHFDGESGDLRLMCEATVDTVYQRTNEKSARGIKAKRHLGADDGKMPGTLIEKVNLFFFVKFNFVSLDLNVLTKQFSVVF